MNLKFYSSAAKESKLKFRKFWGLIPTVVEVTEEKLVRGVFLPSPPILNKVKSIKFYHFKLIVPWKTSLEQ